MLKSVGKYMKILFELLRNGGACMGKFAKFVAIEKKTVWKRSL
jgi:hypothetical protein